MQNISWIIENTRFNTKPLLNSRSNNWPKIIQVTVSLKSPSLKVPLPAFESTFFGTYSEENSKLFEIYNSSKNTLKIYNKITGLHVGTLESAKNSIIEIDILLSRIARERATIGAWWNRLLYIEMLLAELEKRNNINNTIGKIEARIHVLSTQCACGIYTLEDRSLADIEFQLLIEELKRIETEYGVRSKVLNLLNDNDSVKYAESSENIRMRLNQAIL